MQYLDYSIAERRLIKTCSPTWHKRIKDPDGERWTPYEVYKGIAYDLFMENNQAEYCNCIRLVLLCLSDCKYPRRTEEFDCLCDFDGSNEVDV